jgi:hypothetical protein
LNLSFFGKVIDYPFSDFKSYDLPSKVYPVILEELAESKNLGCLGKRIFFVLL